MFFLDSSQASICWLLHQIWNILTSNQSLFQNWHNLTWDLWHNVKTKIFRWVRWYKAHLMHFDQNVSSLSECGNSSLKRFGATNTCSIKIDQSANHKCEHSQDLEHSRKMWACLLIDSCNLVKAQLLTWRHNHKQLNRMSLWSSNPTRDSLTDFSETKANYFFECSKKYVWM